MLELVAVLYLAVHLVVLVVMERLGTRARRISKEAGEPLSPAPAVTMITPVYGADRFTDACLRSRVVSVRGPVQNVFAFQDPEDPARTFVDRMSDGRDVETVTAPVEPGLTGKSSNLMHGVRLARHDLLIFCDDDVMVPSGTIERVASQLSGGCDVVACLPLYRNRGNLAARIYTLYWSMAIHFAWAPVTALGVVRGLWGCMIGLRRSALEAMGGMEEMGAYLAEDLEMGRRAHRLGLRVALGPPVVVPVPDMSWRRLRRKLDMMAFVGIQQNPWGRAANAVFFLALYGYFVAVIAAAAAGPWGAVAAVLFLAGRGLVLGRLSVLSGDRYRFPREYPIMDLLHAVALVRVSVTGRASWGGTSHRAGPGGRLRAAG